MNNFLDKTYLFAQLLLGSLNTLAQITGKVGNNYDFGFGKNWKSVNKDTLRF
jgi:hypothetical protein